MARSGSAARPHSHGSDGSKSDGDRDMDMWSTLLDRVASGKKAPDKQLIVLGGSQDAQRDFVESLAQDRQQQQQQQQQQPPHRQQQLKARLRAQDGKKAPLASRFALGYTYHNVYDRDRDHDHDHDHDDLVARLSLYTLASPSPRYAPLLARLLTPQAIPHTAVVVLLDWAKPWAFARALRAWIRLLGHVTASLDDAARAALQHNTHAWQHRRHQHMATSMTDNHTPLPLGPGEYDDPLGLPLLVVCQNALHIETLEKERGYREAHFDYVLQFLRTVLLKHGAGLVYTMPSQPAQLRPLVHTVLGIAAHDAAPKHNVVDRERVLVPPAWDSWGKIRVLREGFDVEGVSSAWAVEIQRPPEDDALSFAPPSSSFSSSSSSAAAADHHARPGPGADPSTVSTYEQEIQDPHPPAPSLPKLEVECTPDQTFLGTQLESLDRYRAEDEANKKARDARRVASGTALSAASADDSGARAMAEHVGPVQFNMGGIQYDADEVLKQLKERNNPSTAATPRDPPATPFSPQSPPSSSGGIAETTKELPTENLEAYFASLMKGGRGASGSPRTVRDAGV